MDRTKEQAYYVLLEKMADRITDPATFDRKDFVDILEDFCALFNLSKGVTEFYLSEHHEARGDGEIFVDFDNGKGDKVILSKRIVMETYAVLKETLYISQDAEEPSEDDLKKLDLIVRLLLRFVGYNRLQKAVERFGFYDEYEFPNYRYYKRAVEQLYEKGELYGKAAIYLNLHHFSLVNQEVGRNNANLVMKNYFDLLQMSAGDGGIVCRMGGDNFLMLFDKDLQGQVFEVIRGVPVYFGENFDKSVKVSASAGVFVIPDDFVLDTIGDVLEKIVSACQVARSSSKGSIVFYGDELVSRREKIVNIQSLFPVAIIKREFQVYYQPKVNVLTGEMVGAEALCRWFRDGKMVPPGDFIPFLEQSSAICQLDFYMLDSVCKDIKRWLSMGKKAVRVSVNLSRKHLDDDKLLEHLMEIIESNDIPHNYIEIELTETTTDVGFRDLKRVVNGLQSEGICTSVDDFGMGYSSLNLIREIPWNVLKVDRCFLPTDEESDKSITSLMFSHVINMAQDIGLECITEGVETEKQVEILQKNKCTIAQGFFFDRPLPVADFEERLDRGVYPVKKLKSVKK